MRYEKRKHLEQLSLLAFGSRYAYQRRMRQPSHFERDVFGNVPGRRAAGYATLEQIEKAMEEIIAKRAIEESKDLLEGK